MQTINIHQAKTHLSRLIEQAAKGEPFIIAKAGKPLVKVVALDTPDKQHVRPFDFMAGTALIPEDFNTMAEKEIEDLFYGSGDANEPPPA